MTAEQKRNALEVTPVQNGHVKTNGTHASHNGKLPASPTRHRTPAATAEDDTLEECTLWVAFITYLAYFILVAVGYVKEFLFPVHQMEKDRQGYTPLYLSFESFYIRNVYRRMSACFNTPLGSCPGGQIDVQVRETPNYGWSYRRTGEVKQCINFGSYNYLGFAESSGPCTETAERMLRQNGIASCSSRMHLGSQQCQDELEALVAEYLGVEDAVTFSMGFATNSLNIPTLVGRGSLVISDQLNHASLILGLRLSGATIDVFKHNDVQDLERKLRRAIVDGHPRTHRPWKKILIVVEGIYSMEGSICKLPEIIALKKKYKAYLYLDEAHSIGALGRTGRGVCEFYGCDTRDIDVLMGTFTKSFGAIGGYMAGSRRLISHIRRHSHSMYYASGFPPPVAGQVCAVLRELLGRGPAGVGLARIRRLADNTRYFRKRLSQMGFILYGSDDSPVVPLLIFLPAKACAFWAELMKHNVATVIVGFPATPILKVRCRFCVSAAHNQESLDKILDLIDKIGDDLELKYSSRPRTNYPIEYGRC